MSEPDTIYLDENDENLSQRQVFGQVDSPSDSLKRSQSADHLPSAMVADEEEEELVQQPTRPIRKTKPLSQIPKLKATKKISQSMIITDYKSPSTSSKRDSGSISVSSVKTPRQLPVMPSIKSRQVQGVLIRVFRNGEPHHPGVKVSINELEIKSWEAFLNYLNKQAKLVLPTGAIKHVYGLNGYEIRSIAKLQNRQAYVVASGIFIKTKFQHANDPFTEDLDPPTTGQPTNGHFRIPGTKRWRSPPSNGDQIFILPYSRLNLYESILLNRNTTTTYDQWLIEEVTDLLSQYTGNDIITHLYAITKAVFTEVTSFSYLFNTLKVTDTFIACTEEEYQHAKRYLATMKPDDFFANSSLARKPVMGTQRYIPKQVHIDAKLAINWIHGYDGTKDQTKILHALSDHEVLYIIGAVCVIYDPAAKQQRFYTKHTNPITCVTTHQYHTLVASADTGAPKDRTRVSLHIWDSSKLETVAELRKEQFGVEIILLSFSPKPDDNLILMVARDKPKILLAVDWKRGEVIYSITSKSDKILSALFVFDTIEWIACVSQQHLVFYQINWNAKPIQITAQKESEVQNIYTGAIASDHSGELLVVGDKVGSLHVWSLVQDEPKLAVVKESVIENDVYIIVCIDHNIFLLANGQNHIKIWNVSLNSFEHIQINEVFGTTQTICSLRKGLVIGTKSNYILMKDFDSDNVDIIMRGHITPSICICSNKNTDEFFSISSDRYLFKWNNRIKSVEWAIKSPQLISCAALHPERNIIVLGTETSKLLIYDTLSSYYITTITLKANTGVKSVRFSPDGGDLAIGLQNGSVFIFNVIGNGDFQLRTDSAAQQKNVPVTDVVWSVDSSYLIAVYSDSNYHIWSMPTFSLMQEKNVQNFTWQQMTHPITCFTFDKAVIDSQASAIVISPNLILCCSKDGQIRVFGNFYERSSQILPTGLGNVQTLIPSTHKNMYLMSMNNNPAIVEVEIIVESQ
ncbi:unnamed protein product [Adineta ricciae]|uniref:Doublecortin domain-containing protein n=1 Tax=Adineta ricciae TaxID=249248 RepID=A0A813T4T9_ADIRI|nr:unnamed protein product [Adineta ricciae]